jgi:hypothetical protein
MPRQLVVIDPRVVNYQSLIDQMGTAYSYLLLDAESDGVSQIANYVTANPGFVRKRAVFKGTLLHDKSAPTCSPTQKKPISAPISSDKKHAAKN